MSEHPSRCLPSYTHTQYQFRQVAVSLQSESQRLRNSELYFLKLSRIALSLCTKKILQYYFMHFISIIRYMGLYMFFIRFFLSSHFGFIGEERCHVRWLVNRPSSGNCSSDSGNSCGTTVGSLRLLERDTFVFILVHIHCRHRVKSINKQ